MNILGIDLGTNSVKVLVLNPDNGGVIYTSSESYDYIKPKSIESEQEPNTVRTSVLNAIKKCVFHCKSDAIKAVGLAGQMHGTVLYNFKGERISNIITWEDERCSKDFIDSINLYEDASKSGCGIATGFMGPTVYYLIRHSSMDIHHAILPTDWLRIELTDEKEFVTDYSNASSTGFFDTSNRHWNYSLIQKLELSENIFPQTKETTEIAGEISKEIAELTGLKQGIPVTVGGGDQPLSMIGSGICNSSDGILINIGTGSQISQVGDYEKQEELITFCFPQRKFSILGAALSGGASLKWWFDILCNELGHFRNNAYTKLSLEAAYAPVGAGGVCFVPYLSGTRVNPELTARFLGMNKKHTRAHLTRAIMEGVVFELYNFYTKFRNHKKGSLVGAGGGFSSDVWRKIVADVFDRELRLTESQEQTALGAAIIAGVAIGHYSSIEEACSSVRYSSVIETAKKVKKIFQSEKVIHILQSFLFTIRKL